MNPLFDRFADGSAPRLSRALTLPDAYRAIETALARAKVAHRDLRYGFALRQLPPWVLNATLGASDGHAAGGAILVYLTLRLGALLHGARNPIVLAGKAQPERAGEAENEALHVFAPRLLVDCAREKLRRDGLMEWAPCSDPFTHDIARLKARTLRLTAQGEGVTGEERAVLDDLVRDDLKAWAPGEASGA